MTNSQALVTLAQWLAGEFDNQPQAQEQPVWFVHLRLWHRPLPFRIQGNLALFAEQSNALYPENPYRQRIVVLQTTENPQQLQAQYLALKQPDRFRGAGVNPSLLNALTPDDFESLPGCVLTVTRQSGTFRAQPEPDAKCYFQYDGKTRQVVLGFEVSNRRFFSFDRGVDPDTGQSLWGALMGAYDFEKRQDFAAELPLESAIELY
jgi:hypothetical protein